MCGAVANSADKGAASEPGGVTPLLLQGSLEDHAIDFGGFGLKVLAEEVVAG